MCFRKWLKLEWGNQPMAKHDIEEVLGDIETFLKANLNTEITNLNTEKADSITLATVSSSAYFMQSLNNEIVNHNPFIFYGISQVQSRSIGSATAKTYNIQVVLVIIDGQQVDIGKRLLRYSRVLSDLFERSWDRITKIGIGKFQVTSLEPIAFQLVNSSDAYRAVGVELSFTMA